MTNVTLRQRKISNGKISLYLDYYPALFNPTTHETCRHEYLKMYLIEDPKTPTEISYNKQMLDVAEAVRCQRVIEIAKNEYKIFDDSKLQEDFLEYFRNESKEKHTKWFATYMYFKKYRNDHCTFGDISVEVCEGFRAYLLEEATNWRRGTKLSQNTASSYYCIFQCCLKQAFKERRLKDNVVEYLDRIPVKPTKRPFLTLEEVKMLKNTPCEYDVLYRAAMFSILTGFRISDIMTLRWEDIGRAPDGGPCIRKKIQKTDRYAIIYVSKEAISYCGEIYKTGPVFYGLKREMIFKPLHRWVAASGIEKHITFHCFRHTFATLQLAGGTDIYTVSRQLAHQNVQTTQVYADLVDEKRRASATAITLED